MQSLIHSLNNTQQVYYQYVVIEVGRPGKFHPVLRHPRGVVCGELIFGEEGETAST